MYLKNVYLNLKMMEGSKKGVNVENYEGLDVLACCRVIRYTEASERLLHQQAA
jgi:hypothetical protein